MAYQRPQKGRKFQPQGPSRRAARDIGPLLAALGDPTRRDIVERLRAGQCTVGELSEHLPVSRPAVSQHLKVLRDSGIVVETRVGVRHYFALDASAIDALRGHFEGLWQDVLLAFADYVKEAERARRKNRAHEP
jgi:DNA-binding transcriptional ArsR family regulator